MTSQTGSKIVILFTEEKMTNSIAPCIKEAAESMVRKQDSNSWKTTRPGRERQQLRGRGLSKMNMV
eukprot:scaffold7703_cov127-Cylindrotheca_fusiformis.AAC.15